MAGESIGERIVSILLDEDGWFTHQARKYCGKDYGSRRVNQYRFYRVVYKMTAKQAAAAVRDFDRAMIQAQQGG
jgi:hypothetical protein